MSKITKMCAIILLVIISLELLSLTVFVYAKTRYDINIDNQVIEQFHPDTASEEIDEYCLNNDITDDTILTPTQAYTIIFLYHKIPLTYFENDIRILKWNTKAQYANREYVLQAVLQSFGVVPYNEIDYKWKDENEQSTECSEYIDLAYRIGITYGIGDNTFLPKGTVTKNNILAFLDRCEQQKTHLEEEILFPIQYSNDYTKFLSSPILSAIYSLPEYVWQDFIASGWKYRIIEFPCDITIPGIKTEAIVGYTSDYTKTCVQLAYGKNHEVLELPRHAVHEFGHYINDTTTGDIDKTIREKESPTLKLYQGSYCETNKYEYFAEAFEAYIFEGEKIREKLPDTYKFIDNSLKEISERNR